MPTLGREVDSKAYKNEDNPLTLAYDGFAGLHFPVGRSLAWIGWKVIVAEWELDPADDLRDPRSTLLKTAVREPAGDAKRTRGQPESGTRRTGPGTGHRGLGGRDVSGCRVPSRGGRNQAVP